MSKFAKSSLIFLKQAFNTQTQFMYSISIWNVSRSMYNDNILSVIEKCPV